MLTGTAWSTGSKKGRIRMKMRWQFLKFGGSQQICIGQKHPSYNCTKSFDLFHCLSPRASSAVLNSCTSTTRHQCHYARKVKQQTWVYLPREPCPQLLDLKKDWPEEANGAAKLVLLIAQAKEHHPFAPAQSQTTPLWLPFGKALRQAMKISRHQESITPPLVIDSPS